MASVSHNNICELCVLMCFGDQSVMDLHSPRGSQLHNNKPTSYRGPRSAQAILKPDSNTDFHVSIELDTDPLRRYIRIPEAVMERGMSTFLAHRLLLGRLICHTTAIHCN